MLGHGGVSEMVAERRGAHKAQLGVEGDEAAVEGFVVEGVKGDAVLGIEAVGFGGVPRNDPSTGSGQVVRGDQERTEEGKTIAPTVLSNLGARPSSVRLHFG